MLANLPAIVLTEFTHNLEACIFALMQTAPPIEAEEYGLPKKGKTKCKEYFVFLQQKCVGHTRQFSCYIYIDTL